MTPTPAPADEAVEIVKRTVHNSMLQGEMSSADAAELIMWALRAAGFVVARPVEDDGLREALDHLCTAVCQPTFAQIEPTAEQRLRAVKNALRAIADLRAQLDAMTAELDQIKDLAEGACFHFWNCDDWHESGCGQLRPTMARLAQAISYQSDPATDEEISAVLAAAEGGRQ